MVTILLSLLLTLQLTLTDPPSVLPADAAAQPCPLWWGMIDPELSAWFARLPDETDDSRRPVLWNWSWRSFWAALTNHSIVKEAPDAQVL